MDRKKIYLHDNYNPYDFRHFNRIYHEEILAEIQQYIYSFKDNLVKVYGKDRKKYLESFLKGIPIFPVWEDFHIVHSNIMFISNEPGLTNFYKLYNSLLTTCVNLDQISCTLHQSMISWLCLMDHAALGCINGEGKKEKELSDYRYKKYGKIGYFLKRGEQIESPKCIHIDMFAYAQKNSSQINDRNCKYIINSIIANSFSDINRVQEELLYNINRICKTKICSFSCIFVYNLLEYIKKFSKCKMRQNPNKKYLFIIANESRVRWIKKRKEKRWNIKDKNNNDNTLIVSFILNMLHDCTESLDIRILRKWPKGLRELDIYQCDWQDKNYPIVLLQ